jgi:hypothetical protein
MLVLVSWAWLLLGLATGANAAAVAMHATTASVLEIILDAKVQ